MGGCHAGNAPFPFWFRPAPMRILRSLFAVSLDALLYLGMRNGEHAVYETREGVVFWRGGRFHVSILQQFGSRANNLHTHA